MAAPMAGLGMYGCFSSGDCAVRAMCSDDVGGDGSIDGSMDARADTFILPDGPLPDGTCNGGGEDCANGMDDNCNTLVDCADPVCQGAGYSCTDAPPTGWSGPVAFWEAMAMAPGCSGTYNGTATKGQAGLSASPAMCGCTCSGPGNESCPTANGGVYDGNGTCSVNCPGSVPVPSGGGCVNFGCSATLASVLYGKFGATGGSCSANPTQSVPAVSWSTAARTCAWGLTNQQGGCGANKLCVTAPSSPFAGPCVMQAGDLACPMGYPTKHIEYASVSDTRGCSSCTCTLNAGTCNGSLIFYKSGNCQGGVVGTYGLGQPCTAVTNQGTASVASNASYYVLPAGSCAAQGGQPQGSATPSSPTTICCK